MVLSYAIEHLKIPTLVLCGHSRCGAAKEALKPVEGEEDSLLNWWLRPLRNTYDSNRKDIAWRFPEDQEDELTKHSVEDGIWRLSLLFPLVKEAIKQQKLHVAGLFYDVEVGKMWHLHGPLWYSADEKELDFPFS